jgi:hypothetical protein
MIYETNWDADMIYGCLCDEGYEGPSCKVRLCPSGDDPLTGSDVDPSGLSVNEQHVVTCAATSGSFTLGFRDFTSQPLSYNADASTVRMALTSLPTLTDVSVVYAAGQTEACLSGAGHSWTVEFLHEFGDLPLLVASDDNLLLAAGTPSILVTEQVKGTKEDMPCSNRGICYTALGICDCEPEFSSSNGYGEEGQRGDCGWAQSAVTHCPGEVACSGHGVCAGSPTYSCGCSTGWMGGDCSLMKCPEGKAWFGYPTSDNTAHLDLTECSSMGICNRETGVCDCVHGFEGAACERLSCPTSSLTPLEACSGHGACLSMASLAGVATDNGDATSRTYGAIPNDPAAWDHDMIMGCHCDSGYWGHDCSLRGCPTGDDPATAVGSNEVQSLTCTDDTTSGGLFALTFRQSETSTLSALATPDELEAALEALDTIGNVEVSCSPSGSICSGVCLITFLTEMGDLPDLQPSSTGLTLLAVDEVTKGSKENDECSHRGMCNFSTGVCECFMGYGSSDGQGNPGTLADCGAIMPFSISPPMV